MEEHMDRLHNNPPDPIDEALAPFGSVIEEAQNWLDGTPVETEAQMKAVDALTKEIKAAKKAVEAAEESEAKPFYDQWKAAKERYKPTLTDLDRIVKGLVATVDAFKRRLAAEKEAARKEAERLAWEETRKAQEAARQAAVNDIEAQRQAAAAMEAAEAAQKAAQAAAKDTVKGLRTVTLYEVTDYRALLHYIARTDREAITAFIDEWARRNHKDQQAADGLRVWTEKQAF
jgi:ABC-type transporter Mla subunit MlaD